jgi:hypothetical protein
VGWLHGDASKNLVTTRVLAGGKGLHVCLTTAGAPSRENRAFGFKLDFRGIERADVDFSESAGSECAALIYLPPGQPKSRRVIHGAQFAVAQCVEWFIPWQSLAEALPEVHEEINGSRVRPWVRVMPYSYDSTRNVVVDYGPAAACIRLPLNEETLDRLPHEADETTEIPSMIEGQNYVVCGAHGGPEGFGEHRGKWCYDLTVMDVTHSPSHIRDSRENAHYYAFNRKLIAPLDGRVTMAKNDCVDHAAWLPIPERAQARPNYVLLDYGGKTLWMLHNKQGSQVPRLHDSVSAGDMVARIGDSGPSAYPHLHIQVHRGRDQSDLIPIALKNVRVSLNTGKNDYWAREFRGDRSWNIQEGYFFEAISNAD